MENKTGYDLKACTIIETLIMDHFGDWEDEDCIHDLVDDIFETLLDNGIFFVGTLDDDYDK